MIWLTSDTHFFHRNIISYCNRPYADVDEMNEGLIANWNAVVAPDDEVFHLGDFAFGAFTKVASIASRLNGNKHLILGNHDRHTKTAFRDIGLDPTKCFSTSYESLGRVLMVHKPPRPEDAEKYDVVLCGHVHSDWVVRGNCINVGVDVWDMAPVDLASIWRITA